MNKINQPTKKTINTKKNSPQNLKPYNFLRIWFLVVVEWKNSENYLANLEKVFIDYGFSSLL